MGNLSSFLFVRPSFVEGAGRLLDFAGAMNEYNSSSSTEEADAVALEADWTAIANDLIESISEFDSNRSSATAP